MGTRGRSGSDVARAIALAAWTSWTIAGCGLALDLDPPDPQGELDASVAIDARPRVDGFVPECEIDEQCSDGAWCTGKEHCVEGRCVEGEPPCPAVSACLRRQCDEDTQACGSYVNECADDELCTPEGECVPAPECLENPDCPDDGDPCNGSVACASGRCVDLPPPTCGGARGCLISRCVAFEGCRDLPDDTRCDDDGASCTTSHCAPDGTCEHVPDDAACDDLASCTEDRCAPRAAGAHSGTGCVHRPHDEQCVALLPISSCAATVCVGEDAGTPDGCGLRLDSSRCLLGETCEHAPDDPVLGLCSVLPQVCRVDGDCDDHDPCNGEEACIAGSCRRSTPTCPDRDCLQGYCDLRGIVRACGLRATLACFEPR